MPASAAQVSIIVGQAKAGETAVHRSPVSPGKLIGIPDLKQPDINNCWSIFKWGQSKSGDGPCLGARTYNADGSRGAYEWHTYNQVAARSENLGSGLKSLGLKEQAKIGIYSINRPEFTITLLGAFSQSMIAVPIYDTLGADAAKYVVEHAEISTIICAKDKFKNVCELAGSVNGLKYVVLMDKIDDATRAMLIQYKVGFKLISFTELELEGSKAAIPPKVPQPSDLAYIMYTSGTTGNPKGVMLTHQNVVATVAGITNVGILLFPSDLYISYLPMAHSMECCIQFTLLAMGSQIGFYQGDVKKLFDDIADLKPTIIAGVPRVWSRIYDRVMGVVDSSSFIKKTMFKKALEKQTEHTRKGKRSAIWDKLVFDKTKARLGGRVRIMVTGAAPMPPHLLDFLKVVFQTDVFQGYGLTENCGGAVATPTGYNVAGPVGAPLSCTEVKLVDVPEMGYLATDELPRGEVCFKGLNVFSGYYRNEADSKACFDEDGWFHTGDVGRWNADGSLSIIDRKKNIFKLSHGEYVAAENLENIFGRSKLVGQIFVYGNSMEPYLVAVVVPKLDYLPVWAKEKGLPTPDDFLKVCANPELKKAILEDLTAVGKANKIKGFEFVKAIFVEARVNELGQGFNIDNDCLTPSFKMKRPQLQKRYQAEIDKLYAELRAADAKARKEG
mmetsp:Transcript_17633/g.30373  ORF Transcript_17633/g.30373 Transcript_17633/m.30373 type:complete len:671 (+) Transcript_17633:24-2036(+)|eukprot:CAMPEP_0196658786 /NCGR_PEP_ID=MMETSP1086-20130531/31561_1 /TAXON_ID=77921 /ORGANISM="Cyanoptyche  gloeocystis , Strain SAG4.97" /LENGTH=670 /DNA_ID=CAMNT_0041992521 /DNA_START=23 /DNA_END=2035 /DNA_ORIENTATION=+